AIRSCLMVLAQDYDSFVSVQSHSDSAFDAETLPASSVQVGPCIQQHSRVPPSDMCFCPKSVSVIACRSVRAHSLSLMILVSVLFVLFLFGCLALYCSTTCFWSSILTISAGQEVATPL